MMIADEKVLHYVQSHRSAPARYAGWRSLAYSGRILVGGRRKLDRIVGEMIDPPVQYTATEPPGHARQPQVCASPSRPAHTLPAGASMIFTTLSIKTRYDVQPQYCRRSSPASSTASAATVPTPLAADSSLRKLHAPPRCQQPINVAHRESCIPGTADMPSPARICKRSKDPHNEPADSIWHSSLTSCIQRKKYQ